MHACRIRCTRFSHSSEADSHDMVYYNIIYILFLFKIKVDGFMGIKRMERPISVVGWICCVGNAFLWRF